MYRLLMLLLVGTIYAQEPEDCSQDETNEIVDPNGQENNCDMPDAPETSSFSNFQMEQCHNVSVEVNKEFGDICPDKSTCHYQAVSCPTIFAWAQYYCRCRRGNLCSVHNVWANNQIRCVAQSACRNQYYAWIGVWKPANSCAYISSDGSRVDYTNFACGQRRTYGAWCVAMNLSNGLWYTFNCCTRLPYVCTV